MAKSATSTGRPPPLTVPEGVVRDIWDRTRVAVFFYRPDGSGPIEGGDCVAPPRGDELARLVLDAAGAAADVVVETSDGLAAAWPIMVRGRPALVAAARLPAAPPDRPMARRLLAAVGDAVGARLAASVAVAERDGVAEALSQSFEEISLLHDLGEVLRVDRSVTDLLQHVCEELRQTTSAEAAVALVPASGQEGPQTVIVGRLPLMVADLPALVEHVMAGLGPERSVVVNNHCQDDPAIARLSMGIERLVLVSLASGDAEPGALAVFNRPNEEFGSPDAKLLRSSASVCGVFIENRRLYRELQEMMLDLVRALASSIDAKDPYTCGHSERVAITCREIARQLALGEAMAEQAYLAGLLHDIGKIGTPEAILRKEGLLTCEERRIMEEHPVVGSRILAGIRQLGAVREAVLYHHERIDGAGYPARLAADQIPLLARITGLADAYDAMTSNRPYRPMLPVEHVKAEIRRNCGSQFDASVVEAFLNLDLQMLARMYVERAPSVAASGP